MSPTTFTHTGYTGTQVCGDVEKGVYTVLLTNRVYNMTDTSDSTGIGEIRRAFGNAVVNALGQSQLK